MSVFDNVKQTAKNKGLSIEQLADRLSDYSETNGVKVSKSTIYTWKTKEPSAEKIKAVADVLGVSVNYLMDVENVSPTQKYQINGLGRSDDNISELVEQSSDLTDDEISKVLDYMGLLKNGRAKD